MQKISAIVPARNEENFIGNCLDSLVLQDWPKNDLEIVVVDGESTDKTREIVEGYSKKYPFIKLVSNPKKVTPAAMNVGIKESYGDIIIKMDAHSTYNKDYMRKCVSALDGYGADNAGGILKTLPRDNSLRAEAIAVCLSSLFGAGNSYFRIGTDEVKEVDTVSFGCWRREIFDKLGFFNEKLERIEDLEFNLRLRKAGGKIILDPKIIAYYYPQSRLIDFLKHNFDDGIWITYPLKYGFKIFSLRHLLPLGSVGGVLLFFILSFLWWPFALLLYFSLFLYVLANLYFSIKLAFKENNLGLVLILPLVFFIRHVGYGTGSLWGFLKKKK